MTKDSQQRIARRRFTVVALAVATIGLALALAAPPGEAEVTVSGEVIDSACYVKMGAKGAGHAECAASCAKAGIPLAILEDKTDKVWMLASDKDVESANAKLIAFVAKRVTVTGKVFERGGQKLLAVGSVKAAS